MYRYRIPCHGRAIATALLSATIATAGLGLAAPLSLADEAEAAQGQSSPSAVSATSDAAPTATVAQGIAVGCGATAKPDAAAALLDAIGDLRGEPVAPDPALSAAAYQRAVEATLLTSDVRPDGQAFFTADGTGRASCEAVLSSSASPEYGSLAASIADLAVRDDIAGMGVAAVENGGALYFVVLASTGAFDDGQAQSDFAVEQDEYLWRSVAVSADAITPAGSDEAVALNVGEPYQIDVSGFVSGDLPLDGGGAAAYSGAWVSIPADSLTWESSDPAVATVEGGAVTALANGPATVTASLPSGLSATFLFEAAGAEEAEQQAESVVLDDYADGTWAAPDAQASIEGAGLAVSIESADSAPEEGLEGIVYAMDPAAWEEVEPGSVVTLLAYGPYVAPEPEGVVEGEGADPAEDTQSDDADQGDQDLEVAAEHSGADEAEVNPGEDGADQAEGADEPQPDPAEGDRADGDAEQDGQAEEPTAIEATTADETGEAPEATVEQDGAAAEDQPESAAPEPVDLADCTVAGIIDQSVVSDYATPQEPAFTVIDPESRLIDPSEYTFHYENNIVPGEATLVIDAVEGSEVALGRLVKTFEIQAPASSIVTVPDVTGFDQGDAAAVLASEGIVNAQFVAGDPAPAAEQVGTVQVTAPLAGEPIDTSAEVLQVALYAEAEVATEDGLSTDGAAEQQDAATQTPGDQAGTTTTEAEGPEQQDDAQAATSHLVVDKIPDQVYTGSPIVPTVSASIDGNPIAAEYLSVSSIENNVEVGTATLTVAGASGSTYEGLVSDPVTFNIVAPASTTIDISTFTVAIVEGSQVQIVGPGQAASLSKDDIAITDGNVRLSGDDFEIAFENNTAPGTARVLITGVGDYSGTNDASFAVKGAIGQAVASLPSSQTQNLFYTGAPITPLPSVVFGSTTLRQNDDYTLAYTNNVNAGTASITITGNGNYTGEQVVNFTIQPKSIRSAQISPLPAVDYTGAPIEPAVNVVDGTVPLQPGIDYDVAYTSNTNAGTAHVVVTGKGNYRDSIDATFVINKLDMRKVTVVMPNMVYTGSALTPKPVSVTLGGTSPQTANNALVALRPTFAYASEASGVSGIQLVEGVDYDIVDYGNNVQVGEAKVTLRGKGNFTGTKVAAFRIVGTGTEQPGQTQTLPNTGDDTNMPLIVGGAVAGLALVGVGAGLVVRSRNKNRK